MLKLFQFWLLQLAPVSLWHISVVDFSPLGHVLTFWHYTVLQSHICLALSSNIKELWFLLLEQVPRNQSLHKVCLLLLEHHCFQALSPDRAKTHVPTLTCTHAQTSQQFCVTVGVYIKLNLTTYWYLQVKTIIRGSFLFPGSSIYSHPSSKKRLSHQSLSMYLIVLCI